MKVGLISDIHGNSDALVAVLDEAKKHGVERLLIAGDLVGYYYDIGGVLAKLGEWDWVSIGGNHEGMLKTWRDGKQHVEIRRKYGSALEIACESLEDKVLDFLTSLPATKELEVGGRRVLLCHGTPMNRDMYAYPDADEDTLAGFFAHGADLTVFGHTHYPVMWRKGHQLVVNPGSVGQPRDRKPGACWALWDTDNMSIGLHRAAYNASGVLQQCSSIDPTLTYLKEVLLRT